MGNPHPILKELDSGVKGILRPAKTRSLVLVRKVRQFSPVGRELVVGAASEVGMPAHEERGIDHVIGHPSERGAGGEAVGDRGDVDDLGARSAGAVDGVEDFGLLQTFARIVDPVEDPPELVLVRPFEDGGRQCEVPQRGRDRLQVLRILLSVRVLLEPHEKPRDAEQSRNRNGHLPARIAQARETLVFGQVDDRELRIRVDLLGHGVDEARDALLPVDDPEGVVPFGGDDAEFAEAHVPRGRLAPPQKRVAHRIAAPDTVEEIEDVLLPPPERTLKLRDAERAFPRIVDEVADRKGLCTRLGLGNCHEPRIPTGLRLDTDHPREEASDTSEASASTPPGTRTQNPLIKSQLLYQLS